LTKQTNITNNFFAGVAKESMKLLSLVGARPQFIKEAIVGEEIRKKGIEEVLVHSGQHYDHNLSEVFFDTLDIKKPDYALGIGSGTHAEQTGETMMRFEHIVMDEKPDVILVYGDTNTTLAGALVGAKLKIPVAHVEAGLRQHPKDMPEEINRVVTDHVSRFLFCPTRKAVKNLSAEGLFKGVHFVGDVMYDLFLKIRPKVDLEGTLQKYRLQEKVFILATVHRDFNTDNFDRLQSILAALAEISKTVPVVLPLHPRTKKAVEKSSLTDYLQNLTILPPLPYLEMMALLLGCQNAITDSGGLQKEAYFAGIHAAVLMPDTAWIELVETGWNVLVDADKNKICEITLDEKFIDSGTQNLYGKGDAGEQIASLLS
jgi:UDP-N-acetylglucosamine 2-epimerase (non-hydrolysing)